MTGIEGVHATLAPYGGIVETGKGDLIVKGIGNIQVFIKDGSRKMIKATIHDVLLVPGLSRSLLSPEQLRLRQIKFDFTGAQLIGSDCTLPLQRMPNGILMLRAQVRHQGHIATLSAAESNLRQHYRLGHPSDQTMIKMGLKPLTTTCPQCTVAKIHRLSYTSSDRITTRPGEIIGVDLIGPMEVPSFGKGYKFAVLIVDKHTGFRFVRFTKAKSATNVVTILNEFCLEWKGLQGDSPYCFDLSELISDNGSEFSRFPEYCNAKGIRYMHSAPYTPEQNGLAERAVRSTIEGTRALRAGTNLKKSVWAEMMSTYIHLSNLQPRQFNPSPYTMLFRKEPNLKYLRAIGCLAYVHIADTLRAKLDHKAWQGILLGYDHLNASCYRILDPSSGRISYAASVRFDESVFPEFGVDTPPAHAILSEVQRFEELTGVHDVLRSR